MIDNLNVEGINLEDEYPTNYHWLISEIFTFNDNWLSEFNEERNFSPESSYNNFITMSLSYCMTELYKGFDKGKISQQFITRMMYYHILYNYFQSRDKIKLAIETDIIIEIPEVHLEPIFEFALDEKFAISYRVFVGGKYGLVSEAETEVLNRLHDFIEENITNR
ncbi:MAG: hypothetical protein L3J29_09035 [Cyclobacteriaceae bacterium]|nr:hypothetical protein [Cyclobacteriaceae bacterium]